MDNAEKSLERLAIIKKRMARAQARFGPVAPEATLVAVTKTFPAQAIRPLLESGHRVFGENRVQEAYGKWPQLKQEFFGVELHLIGPLQTNKARDAVELFDVIETVDREKLARILAREMKQSGRKLECFVQVNIGNEPQKAGINVNEAVEFVVHCRKELGLNIVGLMCIPPVEQAPAPYFALLHNLAEQAGVKKLSMGMSADFEVALEIGASHIRVGTALFGRR